MDTTMQAERQFKIPFLRPFLLSAVLILIVVVLLGIIVSAPYMFGEKDPTTPVSVVSIPLFPIMVVVAAIPIAITSLIYRLSVDAQGIKGRTNTFAPFELSWADIVDVKLVNIPGYQYLLLSTPTYKAVWWEARYWVPLTLSDMAGFRMAVIQYADPDNPLRRYLESRSYT